MNRYQELLRFLENVALDAADAAADGYPRDSITYYEPPKPKGYWLGSVELRSGCRVGSWRGDSREDVQRQINQWKAEQRERAAQLRTRMEWQSKHWWRRWFDMNPPGVNYKSLI